MKVRSLTLLVGLALAASAFLFASATEANAAELCCDSFGSPGSLGEQFFPTGSGLTAVGIGGIAVNVEGNGPGAMAGDLYVVDRGGNRIEQFRAKADDEGHRFVRASGINVGGVGVNLCTVAAACSAGTASGVAGGMSTPHGIAIDQATGNLYVTDLGNRRVDVFSADLSFEGAFGWKVNATTPLEALQFCTAASGCQAGSSGGGAGQFKETLNQAIPAIGYPAVAPAGAPDAGNVLVADAGNNRADEFSVTLNGASEVSGVAFVRGFGWKVNATTPLEALQTCTVASGCQAGSSGGESGQFTNNGLTRVAVDASGSIYALNRPASGNCNTTTGHCHVQKCNAAVTSCVEFAPTQLNFIGGSRTKEAASEIVVDPASGDVYVARPNNGNPTAIYEVLRFDSAGTLLETSSTAEAAGGVGIVESNLFGLAINLTSPVRPIYLPSTTAGGQAVFILHEPPTTPPAVSTGGTSAGANFSLRTLEGTVNPGGFKVTQCRFEYGTTTAYGTTLPCVPAAAALGEGSLDKAVGTETEPLEPDTAYHYRLVAENGSPAPGVGEDRVFVTPPHSDGCAANGPIREAQGIAALVLPDCMALEMVSPPQKASQAAFDPSISADGERVSFSSVAALGGSGGVLRPNGDTYLASRNGSDWQTAATVPPAATGISKLWQGDSSAVSFSPDFSRWLQIGATDSQKRLGVQQAYEAGLGGFRRVLSQPMTPLFGENDEGSIEGTELRGASADRSTVYFTPGLSANGTIGFPTAYLGGDPQPNGAGSSANTYVARLAPDGQRSLELLARDQVGKIWGGNCGAQLGGGGNRVQGAVSADGTRALFSTRPAQPASGACSEANKLRILERRMSGGGPLIAPLFASECTRADCSAADGDDRYQGASVDGTRVYFTTNRQLANSDLDSGSVSCSSDPALSTACDLYLYDSTRPAGSRLVQVSAGQPSAPSPGEGAEVLDGVTAISSDGSRVYFVAKGVLTTTTNPAGALPVAGQPNLYTWNEHSEATTFVGALAAGDRDVLWGIVGLSAYPVPALGQNEDGVEVGGDGHILVFESKAPLTADDTDGGHRDVFEYDADGVTLRRVSKAMGGSDNGAFDVELARDPTIGTDSAERSRWVSEDGQTVTFLSSEGLVAGDLNGLSDFYVWRDGQLTRLPGLAFKRDKTAATLSPSGAEVAFQTITRLLPRDRDSAADVYVARVNGGFAEPGAGVPCDPLREGSCGPAASPPPSSTKAGSESAAGGNVTPAPQPRPCKKREVRRNGRCVPRPHKRHPKQHRRHSKQRHIGGQGGRS